MRQLKTIIASLVFVVAAACGGGSDDEGDEPATRTAVTAESTPVATEAPAQDETELAESLLLDIQDFPTGWSETQDDSEVEGLCDDEATAQGVTGRAETGDFSEGNIAELSQVLATFPSAPLARVAIGMFEQRVECLVMVFNDGEADTSEATFSDASYGVVSFPELGDSSVAYRLEVTANAVDESEPINEATFYLDAIVVQADRVAFMLIAADAFSPFDSDMLVDVATTATANVIDGLAEAR